MIFKASKPQTLGVELELMLIDLERGRLVSPAEKILAALEGTASAAQVKAEITQSMIEVNSNVHQSAAELALDLESVCRAIDACARPLGAGICGGGAHPFRDWPRQKIFPAPRFEYIDATYGYLARQFTVFGQHVHVGVTSGDDAVRITHWLNRFVPHFIALSAASPFQRGVDTGFESSRVNVVSMFPLSGHMPPCANWSDFAAYFERMKLSGLVRSMKDFYWDVRPKPEFGTVEVRAFDTPLSVQHAVDLAIFVRGLVALGLTEPGSDPDGRWQDAYAVNRFRAARYGLDAPCLDAATGQPVLLADSTLHWLDRCLDSCEAAEDRRRLLRLRDRVVHRASDAGWLRRVRKKPTSWARLMKMQSARLLSDA